LLKAFVLLSRCKYSKKLVIYQNYNKNIAII